VDVAVLFRSDPPPDFAALPVDLLARLERTLRRHVGLVGLNHASPDLVHRVPRDGRLVLDLDRSSRIRFEVRLRNEYFDLARLRRQYRRFP
jgi:hypothetical protein